MTLEEKLESAKEEYLRSDDDDDYYDFCEYYKLEDDIQNNLFNQEFNELHLRWIFINPETGKKTPAFTNDFLYAISTRIYNFSHINLFIFGPTDSGKSEGAQSLADYYKTEFYKIQNIEVDIPIMFSDADLDDVSPTLGYGSMVIRDESSNVTGDDSGILKTKIGNLIRAIRIEQNSFIYVNPDIIEVPLVDYYLRTAGKKGVYYCPNCDMEYLNLRRCPECYIDLKIIYSKCETRFIVYYRQIDPLTNKGYFIPLGRIYLRLHNNKELRDEYEKRKRENAIFLKQQVGLVTVHRDEAKLEKEAQILAKRCLINNISTKIGMEVQMIEYNSQFTIDEAIKMLGGTPKHNRLLFEKTAQLLDKLQNQGDQLLIEDTQETEDSEQDPFEEFKYFTFPYSYDDIIKKAKKQAKFRNVERDFEIYFKVQNGIIYEDIIPDYPNLSDKSSITKIVQKTQNLISQLTGYLFEREYTKFIQTLYQDRVIHDGSPGKPDAYVIVEELNELHIFSLKYLNLGDKYKYIPIKNINAELGFAWENRLSYNKVRLFNIVLNYSMQEILVSEIKDFSRTKNIKLL